MKRDCALTWFCSFALALVWLSPSRSIAWEPLPTITDTAASLRYHGGFFDLYWDEDQGKLLLKIDRWGDDFLLLDALASGLGSNPVGLDRGQLGTERLCYWKRVGPRVFLHQRNMRFRAIGASPVEQRAVMDSFASSILWGGAIVASEPGGSAVLIDITDFVVSDQHDVASTLKSTGQGGYSLASDRSAILPDRLRSFPNNVELEAALTFTSSDPGQQVRAVAATGEAFTVRQRISMIRLPDEGYSPREFHPRVGSFSVGFSDYAAPLDRSMHRRLMTRHRITKTEPIIYYVDPAAPEPIRSALVDGARWWSTAFAEAGFPDGFQVRVAPPNMDPLDVRYNFIQWVHRQTRGWSYGASVVDPRTGEIIKGHVSLGSLRVRQDRLLIDNLTQTNVKKHAHALGARRGSCAVANADFGLHSMLATGLQHADAGIELSTDVALARIRQLSAHEVGHTLGLAHNFAASTYGDRASVMDYPAPRIGVTEQGRLDFSEAYGVGVGVWDKFCIRAMYSVFDDGDQAISQLVSDSIEEGLIYLSDSDARASSSSDPRANLWDDGSDPVEALANAMNVRAIGLSKFNESVLLPGETMGDLRRYFAPLYFHHRYQVDAAVKVIGGVQYSYSAESDSDNQTRDVSAQDQKRAVETLLTTLDPKNLAVDTGTVRKLVPAAASAAAWANELPQGRTSPIFDPLSIVETASELTVAGMLNSQRLGRLEVQRTRNADHPGIALVLRPLKEHAVGLLNTEGDRNAMVTARRIFAVIASSGLDVADDSNARQDVRAAMRRWLGGLANAIETHSAASPSDHDAELAMIQQRIRQFLRRPDLSYPATPAPAAPPGSPIGSSKPLSR